MNTTQQLVLFILLIMTSTIGLFILKSDLKNWRKISSLLIMALIVPFPLRWLKFELMLNVWADFLITIALFVGLYITSYPLIKNER